MSDGQTRRQTGVRTLLERHDFHTKKQFGQNFLVDRTVLERISEAVAADDETVAFEVGPGAGALTVELARSARRVVAVEKDENLRPVLADVLSPFDNVDVFYGDCLEMDLEALLLPYVDEGLSLVFAANLPYYITTPILFRVLESSLPVQRAVVMVQREVADRMVAAPGSKAYGVLSVGVQWKASVKRLCTVPPGAFTPQPGVDSAVVLIDCTHAPQLGVIDEGRFRRIVRAAFSTRRKTLLNALSGGLGLPKDGCRERIEACGIRPDMRAEQLSLEDFATLANTGFSDV